MDQSALYLSLEEPKRSDHLWRYTPWRRIHPTGTIGEIPELESPNVRIIGINGEEVSGGISLDREIVQTEDLPEMDPVTDSFLRSITEKSRLVLNVERGFISDTPIVLDIDAGDSMCALHLSLNIGRMAEFELVTRIRGECEWFGLLRTGLIGAGCNINDVFLSLLDSGTMLRVDSIGIGGDSNIRAGTISSGTENTKSDLRYKMGQSGGSLWVLGSILSAESMHLDHHIEIQHEAPETYSRLSWNSACGGDSRTIGTGMLRVADGARGADAGQLFHNLLLSKNAEADSIPELEVLEHEVVGCGHGTANGPIDESQLFYLESRGLSTKEARDSLISAFLNSTLSKMGSEKLHEWLIGLLSDELEALNG